MGIPVLVLGASGSGKSASLRNFEPDEVAVLNVASKPLPFRKQLAVMNHATYEKIAAALRRNNRKTYVIDDSQYLLAFNMFDKVKEAGYQKFTDMAVNFYNMIQTAINETSDDTIVYMLHHTDRNDDGYVKAKTIGKMLDEKLTVEGLFSIVLLCETDGKKHWFTTQSDGFTTAKSPMELFPLRIDNDLKAVDQRIREYYGMYGKMEAVKQEEVKEDAKA